jgi:hypothetical protein
MRAVELLEDAIRCWKTSCVSIPLVASVQTILARHTPDKRFKHEACQQEEPGILSAIGRRERETAIGFGGLN